MKVIKGLSFDLGSFLGWAYSTCTFADGKMSIVVNDFGSIDLNSVANRRKSQFHPTLDISRIKKTLFEEFVNKLVNRVQFDAYVSEDVFFQSGRVNSYKSLLVYLDILERVICTQKNMPLYKIAPTVVKKNITADGFADKLTIQQAIHSCPEITIRANCPDMDQHSGDAIAVFYAFIKTRLMMTF